MITFKKVRWKNFLSTGNTFTEVDLNKHGTTLIVGENGAGKSTILDALCFTLFNNGFRNVKRDQFVNSINKKDMLTEVEFTIGSKEYSVRRGHKPSIFEVYCNGTMLNQNANKADYQEILEKDILKMSHRSFTQVAVLGSANFTPFMQLKTYERRRIVEDLLDIRIFSVMYDIVKGKNRTLQSELTEINSEIKVVNERITGLNNTIKSLQENKDKKVNEFKATVEKTQNHIKELLSQVGVKEQEVADLNATIEDGGDLKQKLDKLLLLEKSIEDNRKKIRNEIEFLQNNDNCPTCKQGIDENHKKDHGAERTEKIKELEDGLKDIDAKVRSISDRLEEISNIQKQISTIQNEIGVVHSEIVSNQKYSTKLQEEIENLQQESDNASDYEKALKDNDKLLNSYNKNKEEMVDAAYYYDTAMKVLTDSGIRTRVIKQFLPIMNKLINKYLASMEFFIDFNLDEEFKETIRSRFRDDFAYANFSEGEKMRIDLALLFTWRAVAKLRNSVNTNLLILDEIMDSSLDEAGTEEFLRIIRNLTENQNTFVISHKGEILYEKFDNVLRFKKDKNFSTIS
jgi:DNA repair exonuclease SbcCD ATPase subunit